MLKQNTTQTQTQSINNQSCVLRIFSSNVRGIVNNWDAIKQIKLDQYDILLFNEIWQIRDFEKLIIPNFILANLFQRTNNRGGGTLIFIRENIEFKKFVSPINDGIIETTSIIIDNNVFVALYRPPSGNKLQFTDELIDWIESLGNKNIFISGDFNINFLSNEKTYFEKIKSATNLNIGISHITRIASNSCIDNVLTNLNGSHTVSLICIADHQGLISKVNVKKLAKKEIKKFTYREMKEKTGIHSPRT